MPQYSADPTRGKEENGSSDKDTAERHEDATAPLGNARQEEAGETDKVDAARVRQSDAPVDVPQTPDPAAATEDVAAEESKPPKNPDDGSVWSDTELPAPNKKGVRTSWF